MDAVVVRAALVGALGASLTYAAGMLVSWMTLALIPGALIAATAYEMFLDVATAMLIDHAMVVGWISCGRQVVDCRVGYRPRAGMDLGSRSERSSTAG